MNELFTFLLVFTPLTLIISLIALITTKDEKVRKRAKISFVITFIMLIIGFGICASNIGGGGMH